MCKNCMHFQQSHKWTTSFTTENTWGQIIKELYAKILHRSRNHIHGQQIFQQKMILILHASAIFFHFPAHDPSF